MKTLFPQQDVAKRHLMAALRNHGAALNSSETGTGKTLMTVRMAAELGQKAVIVCPKAVIPSWERTFEEQGVAYDTVINYEKIRRGSTPLLSLAAEKAFKWNLPPGSLVVFDEAHMCKGLSSLNASMLIAARAQGLQVLMLSATPFEDPSEMRAMGYALGLHTLNNFYRWAQIYGCQINQWKALVFDDSEAELLEKLNREIYPARGYRLTRKDLGEHFAKCSINWDPLDFGDKGQIASILAEVEGPLTSLTERASLDGEDPIALVKILRARQKVELCKLPLIAEMVQEHRSLGYSCFVALNFRESVTALNTLLNEKGVDADRSVITGGQSGRERQEQIDLFQSNRTRICIANIAAGGTGVNLHDEHGGHPRFALISPSYDAKQLSQALGRTDRVAAQSDVIQRVLTAAGTIEEQILISLQQKFSNLELTHDTTVLSSAQLPPEPLNSVTAVPVAVTPATEPAHAKFGPSSLKYFKSCPGFLGRQEENEASIMGTRIHLALETDDDTPLRDDLERRIAEQCRTAIAGIMRRHRMEAAEDFREVRLTVKAGKENTFGTCDRLFVRGNVAVAADYKTGCGAIDPAEDNMQAKAYTLGVFQKLPDVDTVHFYFIVPQRDEILFATFHRRDVPVLSSEIELILRRAAQAHGCWERGEVPIDMLHVDESICRFCARVSKCPKIGSVAVEVVRRYAPEVDLPDSTHGSAHDDPATVAKMLKLVPLLEKWADGVKHQARFLAIEKGLELPGFQLKPRNGKRSITDPLAAWKCVEPLGVTMDDFLSTVGTVSVSDYESLVGDKAPRGQKKKLTAEVMADLFAQGGVKQTDDSFVLAPVS